MKKNIFKLLSVVGLCVVVSGCQTTKMADNVADLKIDFSWDNIEKCTRISPAFKIDNIPPGTKKLSFNMIDIQVPAYPHGGSVIEYTGGNEIPQGAIDYTGPCPPSTHTYKWTVLALNAEENLVLGKGTAVKPFTP